jgi:hypothetical protein
LFALIWNNIFIFHLIKMYKNGRLDTEIIVQSHHVIICHVVIIWSSVDQLNNWSPVRWSLCVVAAIEFFNPSKIVFGFALKRLELSLVQCNLISFRHQFARPWFPARRIFRYLFFGPFFGIKDPKWVWCGLFYTESNYGKIGFVFYYYYLGVWRGLKILDFSNESVIFFCWTRSEMWARKGLSLTVFSAGEKESRASRK